MRPIILCSFLLAALVLGQALVSVPAHAQGQGQWDGKTESARLEGPYEDPAQTPPPFGVMSYYSQPWRGYMDTWPASKWLGLPGAGWGGDAKYADAMAQLMGECGIRYARVEIGWGSLGMDDSLPPDTKARYMRLLHIFQKNGIRPLFLLNAHHGAPCPMRSFDASLALPAKKGDRTVHFAPGTMLRAGYTGFVNLTDYVAAFPLITQIAGDGAAQLSAPLPQDLPAGRVGLEELKYQPLQGTRLKDGTPVPEAQETASGWLRYAAAIGNLARTALGTADKDDSGFDIEVWNELTFGSNFLDINRYYDPKREYAEPLTYRKTRIWTTALRPDARLNFEQKGYEALLPMTVDYFSDPKNGFHKVAVISGFSNQWPWNSGSSLWEGQAGLSKHYYTGSSLRVSGPEHPFAGRDHATVDALGHLDGKHAGNDWNQIVPGTNFVPTFTAAFPEWSHSAFQTETIQRDLFPDSRRTNTPDWMGRYGRYTHNGDFQTSRYWQTETNWDRSDFINRVKKQAGVKDDDLRLLALNDATNSKMMWRQYVFHCHKGFDRIFLFSLSFDPFSLGLLPTSFFKALDASGGQLTPAVRKTVPAGWDAVRWMTRLMLTGKPLAATRALRVDALVEHKPRLVFRGDGTAAHPSRWDRDFFAFLPFQLSARRFAVPYSVVTLNAAQAWRTELGPLDPARYDLPAQEYDVTVGNCAGKGAKVTAYDPLHGQTVPIKVLASTASTLTVRLRATDYPRVLLIDEARPGPLIESPRVAPSGKDGALVTWTTNVPAAQVRVTYGRDWPLRGAHEVVVPGGGTRYAVRLPIGKADMVACRVRVYANSLTTEWPRWDEDPAGQLVLPWAMPHTAAVPARPPAPPAGPPTLLAAPAGITLPKTAQSGDFTLRLPAGAALAGPFDDQSVILGTTGNIGMAGDVTLRVRVLPGGAGNSEDYLPVTSAVDDVRRRAVVLPSGLSGTLAEYTLTPAAHPGMTNLRQRFLLISSGTGGADLLIVSASGAAGVMEKWGRVMDGVFASVILSPAQARSNCTRPTLPSEGRVGG